jgi:alkylation response protein AidB-like acyl-CoA dehydrogenase
MAVATRDATTTLLDEVERIRPILEEHAPDAEASRQPSRVVYEAMFDAGLFAMLAPATHGGLELHPVEAMRVWEAVARIDASAAWVLVLNQEAAAFVAWLPTAGREELLHDGPTTVAGGFNPPAAATRVEGGWRITGRCPFASGCHNAKWLVMPALEMDGDRPKVDPAGQPSPFAGFFPRSEAKILDNWHTYGLRGTGSTDIAVTDLFIPDRRIAPVAPLANPPPGFDGPLFRMFPWAGILGEAAVSVGVAAAAFDAAVELCKTKTPFYNATPIRQQQLAQFLMGKARARVEASRDTLYRAAEAAYDDVAKSGALLSIEAKIRLQLAVCFAAETCAEAVRLVNDVVGTSSIRQGQPFERYFRDVHVMLQHSDKSSARYGSAGRLMFGLENDWAWLSF